MQDWPTGAADPRWLPVETAASPFSSIGRAKGIIATKEALAYGDFEAVTDDADAEIEDFVDLGLDSTTQALLRKNSSSLSPKDSKKEDDCSCSCILL